jgi:hypothetical protein
MDMEKATKRNNLTEKLKIQTLIATEFRLSIFTSSLSQADPNTLANKDRIGAGADYKLSKSLQAEAEVDYSVRQRINYPKVYETVPFYPVPEQRLVANVSF